MAPARGEKTMKKVRFSEEQMVAILREAEKTSVAEIARKHKTQAPEDAGELSTRGDDTRGDARDSLPRPNIPWRNSAESRIAVSRPIG
jgi:hypothetical protein